MVVVASTGDRSTRSTVLETTAAAAVAVPSVPGRSMVRECLAVRSAKG